MRKSMGEKISVIVPVYNQEVHLEQCIESILNQTYQNLELILVNDGSTDGTVQILENYRQSDSRVRVLNKVNGDLGSSRNAGLSMATGDYIVFVDSDDWIDKQQLEILHQKMNEYDAQVAIANFMKFRQEDSTFLIHIKDNDYFEKLYSRDEWLQKGYASEYNLTYCFTVAWGKMYRRELLNNIFYPEDKPDEDDPTTWKIYLNAEKIIYINKALYYWRQTNSSKSKEMNVEDLLSVEAVEERIALKAALGLDYSHELSAYKWRLQLTRDNALKVGSTGIYRYRNAVLKLKLLEKYGR